MTGTTGTAVDNLVDKYIALLEAWAAQLAPTNRSYAYQADDLRDIEWAIQEADPSEQQLHDRLVALYASWLDAMTPEGRRHLFEHNHGLHGTQMWNHVLEEVLEPRYA
jgi:hypothetical protein